jgi:hypothetical protein
MRPLKNCFPAVGSIRFFFLTMCGLDDDDYDDDDDDE